MVTINSNLIIKMFALDASNRALILLLLRIESICVVRRDATQTTNNVALTVTIAYAFFICSDTQSKCGVCAYMRMYVFVICAAVKYFSGKDAFV